MSVPAANIARQIVVSKPFGKTMASFVIGTVAGLASVFLPRMMLLLSIDTEPAPQRYISLLSPDFVWLGMGFALAIGLISAILEFGSEQEPKAIFMAALGIPALLSGVLNTTSATTKLQKVEQEKAAFVGAVRHQADISQESAQTFEPLAGSPKGPGDGKPVSAADPFFALVRPAFAQSPPPPPVAQQPNRFDPGIQIQRPSYVLVLRRASSQDEAMRLARDLQKDVPTAQAVKTDQGFVVVDSLTPRSQADAVLDAIQLKSKKKLNPSLLQVPTSPARF